jgi:hypothetical protein
MLIIAAPVVGPASSFCETPLLEAFPQTEIFSKQFLLRFWAGVSIFATEPTARACQNLRRGAERHMKLPGQYNKYGVCTWQVH